jgi:hypothetical protein
MKRKWPIAIGVEESEEAFARRLEDALGRPLSLLERADVFEERIRTAGQRAIADLHAAGMSAYYILDGDPGIVRHDANGLRWIVRLVPGGGEEILGEVPEIGSQACSED